MGIPAITTHINLDLSFHINLDLSFHINLDLSFHIKGIWNFRDMFLPISV